MKNENNKKSVEDLKFYGKPLGDIIDGMDSVTMMKIGFVFVRKIMKKAGFFGFIPFMINVNKEKKNIIKNYPEAFQKAKSIAEESAKQFVTMTALINVVAAKEGREEAYRFIKDIFQTYSKYSMPAIYDVNNLVKCNGDVYENYRKYNIAMLTANEDYHVKEIREEPNCLTIIVDRCISAEIAEALNCPEVGWLGCDHDVAGYPVIENLVNSEFRRQHTIAKGDKYCDFMFFRKGTCPFDASTNK